MTNLDDISLYDFSLPENFIANKLQEPPDHCKLLVYDRKNQTISHHKFYDIKDFIHPRDVLFFNDTRVIKARLYTKDHIFVKHTGKLYKNRNREMFYIRSIDQSHHIFMAQPWPKFTIWSKIIIQDGTQEHILEVVDDIDNAKVIKYDGDIFALLEKYWQMPLPHYITDPLYPDRYQPITAHPDKFGSVASPTATLHFTKKLISDIKDNGVEVEYITLHIGLGTFQPIYTSRIQDHDIHTESVQVEIDVFRKIYNYHHKKRSVIATGTTTCRTLESLALLYEVIKNKDTKLYQKLDLDKEIASYRETKCKNICDYYRDHFEKYNLYEDKQIAEEIISYIGYNEDTQIIDFETKIYIVPSYNMQVVDKLITNFHLPKSSLFIMISSIIGIDKALSCYKEAIKKDYKFYSLGDAMMVI